MSTAARPDLGTTRVAGRPGRVGGQRTEGSATPYGRPVLKQPTWTWEIPLYFYTGGLAGASAGLGALAEAAGDEPLAARAFDVALAGALVSPVLLIADLGRPERFLHMLRMFKVTSPMSVGSWILSGFATAVGVGWLDRRLGGRTALGRAARRAAAVLGLPLSSYTAALIADTAVPVWHDARRLLPFVFVSGAAASAGGALTALVPFEDAAPARRLAVGGALLELAVEAAMERRLGDLDDAYTQGQAHAATLVARASLVAGSLLVALRARSRPAATAGGALVNLGALAARWSIFTAGRRSAAMPRHTVEPQRRRADARGGKG